MLSKLMMAAVWAPTGATLLAALAATTAGPSHASEASFTINGTVTDPNPPLGYVSGSTVSFTWVLDSAAVNQARREIPYPSCCSGALQWYQDLFSTTPQIWRSISGSGLTGNWQPPADVDSGSISLNVGNFPNPYPGSFGMLANSQPGSTSGMLVAGQNVRALQVSAVFAGLDAVGAFGLGTIFSATPPDATTLFLGLAGTYAVDPIFSTVGSIWTSGTNASQFTFRVDSLTIATAVPEPDSWAMWLGGGLAVLAMWRRRGALTSSQAADRSGL